MEEDAESVNPHHVGKGETGKLCLIHRCRNRAQRAQKSQASQCFLASAFVCCIEQRIEHHQEHSENRKHDLRQNTNVIDALRDVVHKLDGEVHWLTNLLASCAAGARTFCTAGSMAFSHSSGATPIANAATAAGQSAVRSRAFKSGNVRLMSWVTFP